MYYPSVPIASLVCGGFFICTWAHAGECNVLCESLSLIYLVQGSPPCMGAAWTIEI